jgi:hypothetical protein
VGGSGFFGEETAKLGEGNGYRWKDGIRVENEFLVMAGSLFPIDRIYQQAVIIRKNPANNIARLKEVRLLGRLRGVRLSKSAFAG